MLKVLFNELFVANIWYRFLGVKNSSDDGVVDDDDDDIGVGDDHDDEQWQIAEQR